METNHPFGPYRGAVSLTFDDGTENHLQQAIPLLDAYGLKGTFYVHPRDHVMDNHLSAWQEVARSGHEIGNHTLSHPCPETILGRAGGLESMSLAGIEQDIRAAQERLQQIAPHQHHWTFAYPCYSTYVGSGLTRQSYVPVVAKHFLAGRAAGELGFANRPERLDLACLWATPAELLRGDEMIALVQRLTDCGQWVILVFHDIDGPLLNVPTRVYRHLLRFLDDARDTIWTGTVSEIATRLTEQPGS